MRTIHLFSVVPRLQCSIQVESLSSSASATMAMSQDSSFKLKVVGDDGHRHTVVDTHKDPSKGNMFNALSKLDKDGDGAFRVEDLMRVMEDQQQMSQTVRSQRYALVALTVVIILLFGVNKFGVELFSDEQACMICVRVRCCILTTGSSETILVLFVKQNLKISALCELSRKFDLLKRKFDLLCMLILFRSKGLQQRLHVKPLGGDASCLCRKAMADHVATQSNAQCGLVGFDTKTIWPGAISKRWFVGVRQTCIDGKCVFT